MLSAYLMFVCFSPWSALMFAVLAVPVFLLVFRILFFLIASVLFPCRTYVGLMSLPVSPFASVGVARFLVFLTSDA